MDRLRYAVAQNPLAEQLAQAIGREDSLVAHLLLPETLSLAGT